MMKKIFLLAACFWQTVMSAQIVQSITDPVEYVNTLMGSDSKVSLSNGNTYPAIALPWGMNFWSPQTNVMGHGWMYQYSADKIRGFKQTHQPSPWMNDYGQFSIMPVTSRMVFDQDQRASWFSHKTETAKPYYYSVYLADSDVTAEITPTDRAAQLQFTFPANDSSFIVVDAFDKGSHIEIIPAENKIIGYTTKNSGGVPANFKNYFILEFSKPFSVAHTWYDKTLAKDTLVYTADHVGAIVGFKTKKGEKIIVKTASSFISYEQAALNLAREIGDDPFTATKEKAKTAWNKELNRIKVEGGEMEHIKTFYSCLYRTLLFPRKFYEFNAENEMVHYSPYNGEVRPGYMFTDNGFWDTFRAVFPFFTIMYPEFSSQVMSGLANAYLEGGWLPEWASPGLRNVMIGSNSASIIAESFLKGVPVKEIDILYEALLKNAENEGPLTAVGRKGVNYYNNLGNVPYDVNINENAARTLEYAYDDYAIYRLAKKLNKPAAEINLFRKRSTNYKNLFDKETGLMRGKNKDGSFATPFNPFKWGDAFTEGNSWHYTWSVFHDIKGLANLMGGPEKFAQKLDSVFLLPPIFDESYYGQVIHEIREMQIMNMGQYAHGNQPIQHMIYLYNYAGQPWKTQYHIRDVMNKLYQPTPDGYCGDEDNGQTSAWYLFSAMGFYPVCPVNNEYVFGAPLFQKITLTLQDGKKFIIQAPANSMGNKYVRKISLNDKVTNLNYLKHEDLMRGGKLVFEMQDKPDKIRGTKESAYPSSLSDE